MRLPWQQFVDDFEAIGLFGLGNPGVSRDSSSLIISKAIGLFAMATPCITRDRSSLMISEALGLFGLSNPCATVTAVH